MIPVVDLGAGDGLDAAAEFGAVQVLNHGVRPELISDFGRRMERLLSQPRAAKEKLASPHPYRGWRQWPDDFGRLELERFNVAQFDDVADARAAGLDEEYLGLFAHANMWPDDDPGLHDVAMEYMAASRRLAERMLGRYAQMLGLPGFPMGTQPHVRLTVNDYPTWTHPDPGSDADKLLLLEHADDSVVTILGQTGDYEGLQVQGPDGSWIPVPVIPGALQVFSGALLTRWTGGRMRPGRHRVVAGGTVTRRSTAVFVYPALDTVVAPLTGAREEPVLVWDHVKDRVANYLAEYGRPDQIAAWREGRPYVAALGSNRRLGEAR